MFFADVGLKLGIRSIAGVERSTVGVEGIGDGALGAEELGSAMDSFFVFAETACAIKSSSTGYIGDRINKGTWKGSKV
jgi:hypothetical protein